MLHAAIFIFGAGIGIAVHRLIMAIVLEQVPDERCAYCRWIHWWDKRFMETIIKSHKK